MSLDIALWLAYIVVEAAVVGVLLYRRVWRILPVFCCYCVWDILSNIGVFATSHHPAIYFRAYFIQTIVDSVFQFCVLVELAWSVLRPVRSSLPRISLVVLSVLVLVAAAVIWPFSAISVAHVSRQTLLLVQLQHTVSILRILFFLLLAAGSQLLSIGWRDRELQVATGLGFYSLVNIAISIVQARQSTSLQYVRLEQFVVVSFLVSLIYWLVSFAQKEAARREFTPQMQSFLLSVAGAAHSSRVALSESRSRKDRDSGKS
jgi:hypothetical protein